MIANNDDILIDVQLAQPEVSNSEIATTHGHSYIVVSYEQYMGYQKAIWQYESDNLRYNISSILFMPLFLLGKLLNIFGKLAKETILSSLQFIVYTIFVIENLFRRYYETFINIYGVITIPICMSLNIDNIATTILLTLCLFNNTRLLVGLQRFLIANILGTMDNIPNVSPGKKRYYWCTQIVHNLLLLTNLILTKNHDSHVYIWLLVSNIVSQLVYYTMFPYYLKYKCSNIIWLERYGLKHRIEAILDNKVATEVDRLLPLVITKHTCDTSYNGMCGKCPCAICYDNLDEITTLKCGHIFHMNCIRQAAIYEYQKYKKVECPSCRMSLI